MAENKVMKLWTAIVTAFLALCTALGLVTAATATATAAPRTENPKSDSTPHRTVPAVPQTPYWSWYWSHATALPPTIKQRIGAEAHGKSPSCRHRPSNENLAEPLNEPLTETEAESAGSLPQSTAPLDC
ncbi:DUF6344 domain-containing protein [Streptomyces sp. NPDC002676]